ncbi:MAG: hypothetical protein AAGJ83_16045, partial [Planctomycetota bacterium]
MQKAMADPIDSPQSRQAAEDRIASLEKEIRESEVVVRKLKSDVKTSKPRFVIVPHQGPNGTSRRPIYLECTSDRLIIWPEGVEISKWQLENSSERANPLDEALRAARYHVLRVYEDSEPPYPMIIVRPGGEETFYAAQASMKNWDDQFGYELVPASVDLAYPNADPEMKKRLEEIVRRAADRVSSRAVARSLSNRSRSGIGLAEGSGRGTAVDQLGQSPRSPRPSANANVGSPSAATNRKSYPSLSVSQMDREGRQSGFRDHRMFPGNAFGNRMSVAEPNRSSTLADARERLERQISETPGLGTAESPTVDSTTSPSTTGRLGSGLAASKGEQNASPESSMQAEASRRPDSQSGTRAGDTDRGLLPTNGRSFRSEEDQASTAGGMGFSPSNPMNPYATQQANASLSNANGQTSPSEQANPSRQRSDSTTNQTRPANQSAPSQRPPSVRRVGRDWALPSSVRQGSGNEIVRYLKVEVHQDRLVILPSARHRHSESFELTRNGLDRATLALA